MEKKDTVYNSIFFIFLIIIFPILFLADIQRFPEKSHVEFSVLNTEDDCPRFDYQRCSITAVGSMSPVCNFISHDNRNIIQNLVCYPYMNKTKCSFVIDGEAYTFYTGKGISNLPLIQEGNYYIAVKSDDIRIGDFISFWKNETTTVLHQVVGIHEGENFCYVTKGLNNKNNDTYCVQPEKIIGRISIIFRDTSS